MIGHNWGSIRPKIKRLLLLPQVKTGLSFLAISSPNFGIWQRCFPISPTSIEASLDKPPPKCCFGFVPMSSRFSPKLGRVERFIFSDFNLNGCFIPIQMVAFPVRDHSAECVMILPLFPQLSRFSGGASQ